MIVLLAVIPILMLLFLAPTLVGISSAVLALILVLLGKRESNSFNPYYLFLSTPISLILYSSSVSEQFLPALDEQSQVIITLANYAYVLGLSIYRCKGEDVKSTKIHVYSFNLIFLIGLLPHIAGFLIAGFPLLSSNVAMARTNYYVPILGQFSIFLPLSMLIAFQRHDKKKVIFSLGINIFLGFMTITKFSILFSAMFFFYGYFRYEGKKMFKIRPIYLVAIFVPLTPLLFEYVFYARENFGQINYYWRQNIKFESAFLDSYGDMTYLPYLYLTTPWTNFSYIIQSGVNLTYGARTIHSLASVLQVDWLLDYDALSVRNEAFNTHAFLTDFYADFGVFGCIALSFILGVIVKWAYARARSSNDELVGGVWVSFAFASFMLFFSNHFTRVGYPAGALVLFSFYSLMSRLVTVGRFDTGFVRS